MRGTLYCNTDARHPNLIYEQAQSKSTRLQNDALRRMAIRNSYETRSLGGATTQRCTIDNYGCTNSPSTSPSHILPPISKRSPTLQRSKHKPQRSLSPASVRCFNGGSVDHLQVVGVGREFGGSMKRSSSHSSVAMKKTTPTIQTGSSSYVYHTPSGRRIGSTNKMKQGCENVQMQVPQSPLDIRRSSSYSTVSVNISDESGSSASNSPLRDHSESAALSSSYHGSGWTDGPATVYPQHVKQGSGSKVPDAWSSSPTTHILDSRYSPPLNQKGLHNLSPEHHPQLSLDSNYRRSFKSPQSLPQYDRSLPITRFGSTPSALPATGIVPQLMYAHHSTTQLSPKRVRLHTPRGKKVASLV